MTQIQEAETFRRLIEASDGQLRGFDLDHGLEFAAARCEIYTGAMAGWAEEQREEFGYDRPFAVVALDARR